MNLPAKALPAHSTLGASSYSRWKACPGSVKLSEGAASRSSVYADEGTRAHDLAEKILNGKPIGEADLEMLAAVRVYTDFVDRLTKPGMVRKIEQKFDLTKYHPKLFGTADAVLYEKGHLVVVDYKHGQGIAVDVKDAHGVPNVQLMYYAVGALHVLAVPIQSIEIVIVQPRCFHADGPIRSLNVTPYQALEFIADLIADAKATESPDAPLNPGSHCRWCPAQPTCPEIRKKALALAQLEFSPSLSYDPAKLAEALAFLPMLEGFSKSVREFAYREAEMGRPPPGYKLVDKRAMRKWLPNAEKLLGLRFNLATHQTHDVKLKSPAQIEKILPANLRGQLDAMTIKESSGKTLVPTLDSRDSIQAGAQGIFDPVESD